MEFKDAYIPQQQTPQQQQKKENDDKEYEIAITHGTEHIETIVGNQEALNEEVREGLGIEEAFSLTYVNSQGRTCPIKTDGNWKMFLKSPPAAGDLYHVTVVLASASGETPEPLPEEESSSKVTPLNRLLKSIGSTSEVPETRASTEPQVKASTEPGVLPNNGVWVEHNNIDMCGQGEKEQVQNWKSNHNIDSLKQIAIQKGYSCFIVSDTDFHFAAFK